MDYFIGNIYIDDKRIIQNTIQLEQYISKWNKKIKKCDTVYILAGILNTIDKTNISIVKRLNGKKILIFCEKDKKNIDAGTYENIFDEICSYKMIKTKGITIFMSYTPFLYNKYPKKNIVLYSYSMKKPEIGIKDTIFYSIIKKNIDEENIKFIDINWKTLPERIPLSLEEIIQFKEIRKTKRKRNISISKSKK